MRTRAFLAALATTFAATLFSAEIGMGDSRETVLAQLGKPTSIARRGDHEIFLYPKGGRVEFVHDKVTDVKGPLPTVASAAPVASAPAPTARTATAKPEAATKTVSPAAPKPPRPPAAPTSDDYNPAVGANELAKHVEKMDTAWGTAPPRHHEPSALESLPAFLAGLLLRFGLTIVALKLAFKYWEMDAFWNGIFAIAGIDVGLHGGLQLLGPATGGFTTMGGVENGIPGLVLIYTIGRFCFNKRLQNAILTAAAVKTVVMILYLFAGLALLNVVFG